MECTGSELSPTTPFQRWRSRPTAPLQALLSARNKQSNEPIPPARYELRKGARDSYRPLLDQDDSGDFDPDQPEHAPKRKADPSTEPERELKRARKPRPRVTKETNLETCLAKRHIGCVGVATLKILPSSQELLAIVSTIDDHWPDGACILSSESAPQGELRRTRTRGVGKHSLQNQEQRPFVSFGDPAGRGCWSCYEHNSPCSIVDENFEFHWPCKSCIDSGASCELIRQPVRKGTCDSCSALRVACSYNHRSTRSWEAPCKRCSAKGFPCIAGPKKGFEPVRISLARYTRSGAARPVSLPPAAVQASSDITPRTCKPCLDSGRYCSAVTSSTSLPCNACELQGIDCYAATLESQSSDTPQQYTTQSVDTVLPLDEITAQDAIAKITSDLDLTNPHKSNEAWTDAKKGCDVTRPNSNSPTPVQLTKAVIPPGGAPNEVTTRARRDSGVSLDGDAHTTQDIQPVRITKPSCPAVNLSKPKQYFVRHAQFTFAFNTKSCDLCADSALALFGKRHQSEKSDGPAMPLYFVNVCRNCTSHRTSMMRCQQHHINQHSSTAGRLSFLSAYSKTLTGLSDTQNLWCAVCPALATHSCDKKDCGLSLCSQCAEDLKLRHAGRLDDLLAKLLVDVDESKRPFGVRVDAELLRVNGQLDTYLRRAWQRSLGRALGV